MSCPDFCDADGEPIPVGAILLFAWWLSRGASPRDALARIADEYGSTVAAVLGRPAELAHVQQMVQVGQVIAAIEPGATRDIEIPALPAAPPSERALGDVVLELTIGIPDDTGQVHWTTQTIYGVGQIDLQTAISTTIDDMARRRDTPRARQMRDILSQATEPIIIIGHYAYAPGDAPVTITITR